MESPQESDIWVSENGMGNFNREDDAPGDPANPQWAKHGKFQADLSTAMPCLTFRQQKQRDTHTHIIAPEIG
jgi:hypothetical protein